jgi:putative endonuclease
VTTHAHQTGAAAEALALEYLEGEGLELRARNFRIRRGEIDLIMEDRGEIVFVEVRARHRSGFGDGIDSITAAKRRRLIATAKAWLQRQRNEPPTRFDVIAVTPDTGRVEWIRDAFHADE